ncbi:preQ(0) biosynthesis protein QueC [Pelagirhabdus alkalitolerans]|uniref:7-cyano-7-deazaguanine synthase n=1 Tax=Pelagirhabdus alkalitolerans TaxID=1612202 RepID=A0A1G6JNJ1_9BACI|nr:7-cyano-7-deazaguanine synthase QueC [Pelagirhabdus alkalitolerans]SDC20322.1 preQ(0) biosynthesis protein QueC [Pelagirhabdus alkalitolerans]
MRNEKAVVVFSGGQDSTTCLFWALKQFQDVSVVTFDYNQRHKKEIEIATSIAKELGITQKIMDMSLLSQLAPNALTRDSIDVKDGEGGKLPSTFVPGRNLLFLSFAGVYAQQIGAKHLITGVSQTDFSGYPDCRNDFIQSMNTTLNLAMDQTFTIHTPLMWLDKAQTWALSHQLGVLDFIRYNTLTCYEGMIGEGCQVCPACKLRQAGLDTYLNNPNDKAYQTLEES